MHMIDLRSDTVTKPTEAMRKAMMEAEVGDDVYGEDPTVNRLEQTVAQRLGKQAGLLVSSGTMGNLIALLSHTSPGQELVCETDSHIYFYEVGGLARIAGLTPRLVEGEKGILQAEAVRSAVRGPNIHFPALGLITIENTHNRGGGTVYRKGQVDAIAAVAEEFSVPLHVDGARLFNACIATDTEPAKMVERADSVTICLSKGLSAPVGSVLVGDDDFIGRARKNRKLLGGGMRQAGIIAAAGLVALDSMVARLAEDHRRAKALAEGLSQIDGISLDLDSVVTNMFFFDLDRKAVDADRLLTALAEKGIKVNPPQAGRFRLVTHRHITDANIGRTLDAIQSILTA